MEGSKIDFGTLKVTYIADARPVERAASEVDRINRQTAKNAEANDRTVERSKRSLADVQTREARRAANNFIRELERVRQAERASSGGIGGDLSTLTGGRFAFAGGGAVAGVGALTVGFVAAAREGIRFQEVIDRLTKSFTTLLGSQQAATAHLKELQAFAAQTPFEFEQVAQASQKFINMGRSAQDVIPLLTAVGEAVARAGGGSEEIERVAKALSDTMARGKVSAQEMNQLANNLVDGWKPLEQELGKTRGELFKMAEEGKISSETFIQAFTKAYGSGEAMRRQMETLSGATSTLKDKGRELLGQSFAPLHAMLRDIAVELAKISTEGFNAQRGLTAAASVFRSGFNMANLGGGDNFLIALAYQQGGPQAAAMMAALLRGATPQGQGAAPAPPPLKTEVRDLGGGVTVNPDTMRPLGQGFDDALRRMEQARAEATRQAEEAMRKARAEAERQAGAVRGLTDNLRDLTIENKTFNQSEVEQQIALMRARSGVEALTGSYRAQAEMILNITAAQMRLLDSKQQIREEEERQKKAAQELAEGRARAERAFIELLGLEGAAFRSIKDLLTDPAVRNALTVQEAKMLAVLATMKDMKEVFKDIPLTPSVPNSQIQTPPPVPLDFSNVQVDPWIDFRERFAEIREELGGAGDAWREGLLNMAEDGSQIFADMFMRIGEGWKSMLGGLVLDFAQSLQQMAAQALANQVWGAVLKIAGSALGGALGPKLPSGSGAVSLVPGFGDAGGFAGNFAEGGFIPPGQWGWTGERGPEPVFGGKTGVTVAPNGGQTVINNTTIINYQPRNVPNSVTSRRSTRESFEALLAFAR